MSRDIQQLLQECLEGYDAGLTPEECLSAYPHVRAELEPLLRQALSLRVAYAASPRAEFRFAARERLLFAAGRDIKRAYAAEPEPQFVQSTRQRLLNRAGAQAQEALRDVPPPRLPFWMNARRHLLEAASAAPPKPAHHAAIGMRSALSAAVVVLAVAIAGAGFFLQNSPANQPQFASVNAELAYITEQLNTLEQLKASGFAVPSSELDELATRTNRLAEQVASSNDAELKDMVLSEIERQRGFLPQEGSLDALLAAAEERLAQSDVNTTTVTGSPQPSTTPATAEATEEMTEPEPEPSPEPTATVEVAGLPDIEIISPDQLATRQLVQQFDAGETALDLRWWRVTTGTLSFVMPEAWSLLHLAQDANGLTVLPADYIFVETNVAGMMLVIDLLDGEVSGVLEGDAHVLRGQGAGPVIDPVALIAITGEDEAWAALYNMLISLELFDEESPDEPSPASAP